ncbi:MAG TPA: 30S ribosomal protein S1 [Acidobacteriota bacterium]|nr:30S ribosomal protein S1 [Acidobacteriota bacterium]
MSATAESKTEEGQKTPASNQAADKPSVPDNTPVIELAPEVDQGDLEQAYEKSFRNLSEGEVVPGKVLKVTDSKVVIDVGYKSEGIIDISEFAGEEGEVEVKAGDVVDVLLENTEDSEGYIVVSREKAERMKIWDSIEKAYNEEETIVGRVIERVKGGLSVDIGVRAFLPGSQVDLHPVRNLDALRGEDLRLRVIKVNKRRGNIVLSRKAVLEEEYYKLREKTLADLEEGKVMEGVVKNLTDYGAFVDLGGIDGLLHITDMSWGRVNHPSDLFNIGDRIQVKILKFDRLEEKVSLGYKQLSEDPWLSATERFPQGTRVVARVVSITDYGAFVELEEGVEGLIHISEMTWNKRIKHPSKLLSVGDEVEAQVLDMNAEDRRISLGMKQTEPNPWDDIEEKYAINSIVTGIVRNMTDFGAFVEVEEGVEGLVHVSDLSWTKKVKHPSEILKKGQEVQAMVLNVDAENQRLSLGLKQLEPDKWEEFFSHHQIGDVLKGKIVRLTGFGAFIEVADGIEGLCHVSELAEERIEDPEDHFSAGQDVEVKIIKMNLLERKIGLSIKALQGDGGGAQRDSSWSYKPAEVAKTSLAEKFDQLGAFKRRGEGEQKAEVEEKPSEEESSQEAAAETETKSEEKAEEKAEAKKPEAKKPEAKQPEKDEADSEAKADESEEEAEEKAESKAEAEAEAKDKEESEKEAEEKAEAEAEEEAKASEESEGEDSGEASQEDDSKK